MMINAKRRSYFWNSISGVINAGQSAVILILLSHYYSIIEAGVFSISYAVALLGMTLSKYGQRNYQVTDVNRDFSFKEYSVSRWFTVSLTLLFTVCCLFIQWSLGKYDFDKALIVFLICCWKQIDSIEDVYYGMYQQKGRLDIGAKRYSERLLLSTTLFCLLLFLKIQFLFVVLIVVMASGIIAAILINIDRSTMLHKEDLKCDVWHVRRLLLICLTLCISSTLAIYIGNLPKYFIDVLLEDSLQAQFGYLIMPAFVIMVLSTVLFQPIIRDMGEATKEQDYMKISGFIRRQLLYIIGITGFVLLGGGLLGIPILNALYHVDLSAYWKEFMYLLIGGGFYAVSQFLVVPIVSLRKQNDIAVIYLIVAVISVIIGMIFVSRFELLGASLLYLVINVILSLLLMTDCCLRLKQIKTQ